MHKSFKVLSDPRIIMRVLMGLLLAGDLVVAVVAFHPFGGSAEDLQRQRDGLESRLQQARDSLAQTRRLSEKVKAARTAGDQFMDEYILDSRTAPDVIAEELHRITEAAGIHPGPQQYSQDAIEGSETLQMWSISMGFESDYAKLAKFVELVDKSPKFLILDNLQAAAPQNQAVKSLTATVKIKTFVRVHNSDLVAEVAR